MKCRLEQLHSEAAGSVEDSCPVEDSRPVAGSSAERLGIPAERLGIPEADIHLVVGIDLEGSSGEGSFGEDNLEDTADC